MKLVISFDHNSDGTWTADVEGLAVRAYGDTLPDALETVAARAVAHIKKLRDGGCTLGDIFDSMPVQWPEDRRW